MIYKWVNLSLLLLVLFSCSEEKSKIVILSEGEVLNRKIILNKISEFDKVEHSVFTSLAITEESVVTFDLSSGQLFQFDTNGKLIDSTGGIGKGPNEFVVDANAEVGTCDHQTIFAYDWHLPKIKIYDHQLHLIKSISLNNIPYEISCYKDDSFILLYSTSNEVDIINKKGEIEDTFVLQREELSGLGMFMQIHFEDDYFFQAYMLEPKIVLTDVSGSEEIICLKGDIKNVRSATRAIHKIDDQIHLFYSDVNQDKKFGYVFSDKGQLMFMYEIPPEINLLTMISEDELIAIEQASQKIVKYRYSYE